MKEESLFIVLAMLLFGSTSASEKATKEAEALVDKISTTIAEVTWAGKHNRPGDRRTVQELLVNETLKQAGGDIVRLRQLMTAHPGVTALTDRLATDSVKKVESLEAANESPLMPRFLCEMEKGLLGALSAGVSASVNSLLKDADKAGGCVGKLLGGFLGSLGDCGKKQ